MRAVLGTIVCKFGGDTAIRLREEAIFVKSQGEGGAKTTLPMPTQVVGCETQKERTNQIKSNLLKAVAAP